MRSASTQNRADADSRQSVAAGLVRLARPKQWVKNLLVFAAPGAAGVLFEDASATVDATLAFVVFCLAASGTYFLNDAFDADSDRRHPTKRHRPIASGVVPQRVGLVGGVLLLASSVALGFAVGGSDLAVIIGIYVTLQPLYSAWLKNVAVVDLAAVASGFVLRAIAGGVASDVPISQWFLIVASFGSLFMVAGKRHAEHLDLGDERDGHRPTLGEYSLGFLRYVRSVSSGVAIAAYCLWAFEKADGAAAPIWFEVSVIPFVIGMMRYALLLEAGKGGAPEDVVFGDRPLQVIGFAWAITFAMGIYG